MSQVRKSKEEAIRAKFLQEGRIALELELERKVEYATSVQEQFELPSRNILSSSMLIDKNLPKKIRKEVHEYGLNLRKIIAGTANFIEKSKFSNVQEIIRGIDLNLYDKGKLENFFDRQRELSFSFQTLSIAIELFSIVNESIKKQIDETKFSAGKNLRVRLKNAVLAFELTNFVTDYIEKFALKGKEAIAEIKKTVDIDLEKSRKRDESLKEDLNLGSSEINKNIIRDIEEREKIRGKIMEKWKLFEGKINEMEKGATEVRAILPDLYNIRKNAEIQIDILGIIAIMQVIDSNIEIVKSLPERLSKNLLVPFSTEDACQILGIEVA